MTTPSLSRLLLLTGWLALLAGCGEQPVRPPPPPPAVETEVSVGELQARGDHGGAAELLERQAEGSTGEARARLLLEAGEERLLQDRPDLAQLDLTRLEGVPLSTGLEQRRLLLEAAIDLALGDTEGAAARLAELPILTGPLRRRQLRLEAEVAELAGDTVTAARRLLALWSLSERLGEREQITDRLWPMLRSMAPPQLESLAGETGDAELLAWLDLARIEVEAPRLGAPPLQRLAEWERRHADHPALQEAVPQLRERLEAWSTGPRRIAVLLPLSGPLAKAASAIRDGMIAAYYADSTDPATELRFYDTTRAENIFQIYQQALEEGAERVVGPLRREMVDQLTLAGEYPVPVLTLNFGDQPPGRGMTQFALSPEDEARQVAGRAVAEGLLKAVALYPQGAWGDRVHQAFVEELERLGGEALESAAYPGTASDFSRPIRQILNLDDSSRRYREVKRITELDLKFEPRRRADAEWIFSLAFPRQGRLIAPQLDFHHASDLPVYATSHIYRGTPEPVRDRDLEGVRFCDMPWAMEPDRFPLREPVSRTWPKRVERHARLFALGIDAYRILAWLDWMAENGEREWEGVTGTLSTDSEQRIRRRLAWGEFRRGKVQPLADAGETTP